MLDSNMIITDISGNVVSVVKPEKTTFVSCGGTYDYDHLIAHTPIINADLSDANFVMATNTIYRHTGVPKGGYITNKYYYSFNGTTLTEMQGYITALIDALLQRINTNTDRIEALGDDKVGIRTTGGEHAYTHTALEQSERLISPTPISGAIPIFNENDNLETGTPTTLGEATNKLYVDSKAPLNSPAFTGTPIAPTPAYSDNSTKLATTAFIVQYIDSKIGAVYGLCPLDSGRTVPASFLPSFVDDIINLITVSDTAPVSATAGDLYYNTTSKYLYVYSVYSSTWLSQPAPEDGKIYVAKDTNLTYRWSGTDLVEISKSLALGETALTAYPGDKGKYAYDNVIQLLMDVAALTIDKANTSYVNDQDALKINKTDEFFEFIDGTITANAFIYDCQYDYTLRKHIRLTNTTDTALTINNPINGYHFLIEVYGGYSLILPSGYSKAAGFNYMTVIDSTQFYLYEFYYNGTTWRVSRNVYDAAV